MVDEGISFMFLLSHNTPAHQRTAVVLGCSVGVTRYFATGGRLKLSATVPVVGRLLSFSVIIQTVHGPLRPPPSLLQAMAPLMNCAAAAVLLCPYASGFVPLSTHTPRIIPAPSARRRHTGSGQTPRASGVGRGEDGANGKPPRTVLQRPWDVEVEFSGERRVITVQPGDSILEAVRDTSGTGTRACLHIAVLLDLSRRHPVRCPLDWQRSATNFPTWLMVLVHITAPTSDFCSGYSERVVCVLS